MNVDEDFRASARRIGLRMALLYAGLVLLGAVIFLAAILWKVDVQADPIDPVDPVDLAVGFVVVGVAAVVVAGAAFFYFAREATAPLAAEMRRQRTFIADASHELRTPLSTMHLRVQHLEALAGEDVTLEPVIADLRRDTAEIVDIVSDLLDLASGHHDAAARADVSAALHELPREHGVQAQTLEVDLAVEGSTPGLCVNVSPAALRRSLSALVTNALSHTPSGGRVRVWASTSGEFVVLRVADTGTGIRGIDPGRVFDRFAHGAPGALPSHGVGLALVRDTAAQAGGTVAVESTGPRGTTMSLMLKEAR